MKAAAVIPLDAGEPYYDEWEQEEKTPMELETIKRLIARAIKQEVRPLIWIAVVMAAALIGLCVAAAFTLWGPT